MQRSGGLLRNFFEDLGHSVALVSRCLDLRLQTVKYSQNFGELGDFTQGSGVDHKVADGHVCDGHLDCRGKNWIEVHGFKRVEGYG